jgi:hypothetical protein
MDAADENILCLSSGLMPQYRLDILRVIALPDRATIQFRYSEHLVHADLRESFTRDQCVGRNVLIGHVDGNPSRQLSDRACPVTLCRQGSFEQTQRSGSYFVLKITLGSVALTSDWDQSQSEIESVRPRHRDDPDQGDPKPHPGLSGLWCFETMLTTTPMLNLDSVGIWETVVKQLWQSPDFQKQAFFFAIDGLYASDRRSVELQSMSEGHFTLRADKEYELRVLHWHPEADLRPALTRGTNMTVNVESPQLRPVTSPRLPVDSPYDVKAYRVRSGASTKEEFGSFVVKIEGEDGKPVSDQPEIFLPVRVRPSYVKIVALTVLLAALLWLQQLVPLLSKGPVDKLMAGVTFLIATIAAFVVVFGIKKPLS